jgi:hypothetical protein
MAIAPATSARSARRSICGPNTSWRSSKGARTRSYRCAREPACQSSHAPLDRQIAAYAKVAHTKAGLWGGVGAAPPQEPPVAAVGRGFRDGPIAAASTCNKNLDVALPPARRADVAF